ncbi:diadenylate cyclase [Halegenticoccus tardaugens]|uniref:diadenylate cyclase n=1 Tax=Halegenticoccus tardaugens TaxID=2071624 RepID=UPI00100B6310|nr:diadenylate cyclase [Halegenticoccus tardaugens]
MTNLVESMRTTASEHESSDIIAVLDRIEGCVEDISRGFERWDDPYARGPGLYFVVERDSVAGFTDPMGTNRWPVEDCASVFDETDALLETARGVAFSCDGAVVIHNDGTIQEEMVRVNQLLTAEQARINELPYTEWMGTRHMSSLETATREEVVAAITLSEEDGRVTVFTDKGFEDYLRTMDEEDESVTD